VTALVTLAIAVVVAWAVAMSPSRSATGVDWTTAVAILLAIAALGVGWSLVRVKGGVLSSSDGVWTYAPDLGPIRSGPLAVALDLGSFLLLRIGEPGAVAWLPVQRHGLERDWHALRCAAYSLPPVAAGSPAAPRSVPE
jgi:hypothetical protein